MPLTDYERYQLEWMIAHGYSLRDLMESLDQVDRDGILYNRDAFDIWENDYGFDGEIYACEAECGDSEESKVDDVQTLPRERDLRRLMRDLTVMQRDYDAAPDRNKSVEELFDLWLRDHDLDEALAHRAIETKTLSVHGRVSLLYCMAIRFDGLGDFKLMAPYLNAGYHPGMVALLSLDPARGPRLFYTVEAAQEFDCDLGDALAWVTDNFEMLPDDGYLLDLPYIRGDTNEPTTTFEREYIEPYRRLR